MTAAAPAPESIPPEWIVKEKKNSKTSASLMSSNSLESLKSSEPSTPIELLAPVPKAPKKSTPPIKNTSSKSGMTLKIIRNSYIPRSRITPSSPSSPEPIKAAELPKKTHAEVLASKPSPEVKTVQGTWTKVEHNKKKATLAPPPQPQTNQQFVPTEKKSKNQNKKTGGKVAPAPALSAASLAKPDAVAKKVNGKKQVKKEKEILSHVVDAKKIDDTAPAPTSLVIPNITVPEKEIQDIQMENVKEDDPAATIENAAATESAQGMSPSHLDHSNPTKSFVDDSSQSEHEDTPSVPKKKRRNQKSGAQRKQAAKNRTPEETANTEATNFIDPQIKEIKDDASADASDVVLPSDIRILKQVADCVPLSRGIKKHAEQELRDAMLSLYKESILVHIHVGKLNYSEAYKAVNGTKITKLYLDRVKNILQNNSKQLRYACGQLELQKRALQKLKTFGNIGEFDLGVDNMVAHPSKLTISKKEKKAPAPGTAVSQYRTPATPQASYSPPPTSSFDFSMPSVAQHTTAAEKREELIKAFVFGQSTKAAGIVQLKVAEPAIAKPEVNEPDVVDTKATEVEPTVAEVARGMATESEMAEIVKPKIFEPDSTALEAAKLKTSEPEELELAETDSREAVAIQATTTTGTPVLQPAETSEPGDLTHDSDTTLVSDGDSVTDDESHPITPKEKMAEPLLAPKEYHDSFVTGTALVLAPETVGDKLGEQKTKPCMALMKYRDPVISGNEVVLSSVQGEKVVEDSKNAIVVAWKANKPCLAMMKYHGSLLSSIALPLPADKILIEVPQIRLGSDMLMSFVPVLSRPVQGPVEFPRMVLRFRSIFRPWASQCFATSRASCRYLFSCPTHLLMLLSSASVP